MNDSAQKTLNKIKQEQIKPKPKWEFTMKYFALWFVFGILLLISGLAVSAIIYIALGNPWELLRFLGGRMLFYLLISLPYLWVMIMALSIFLAVYNLRHSKTGYRYKNTIIIFSNIALSVILGITFYYLGLGAKTDDFISEKIPAYDNIHHQRARLWLQPEQGMVAGKIEEINNEKKYLILRDFENTEWEIDTSRLSIPAPLNKNLPVVVVIGEQTGDNTFIAEMIRPLGGPFNRLEPPSGPPVGRGGDNNHERPPSQKRPNEI